MLPLKLGKLILKVLPRIVYCIRVADDRGPKDSTIRSIQTGLDLIVEEDYAATIRVGTAIGVSCPWHTQSQETYGDPTLISIYAPDPVRLGSCWGAAPSPQSS